MPPPAAGHSPQRIILLRRPPQLSVIDGRFVPSGVTLDAVDAAWQALRARVPRAYDGPLLHVLGTSRNGHGGVVVHLVQSSYRFHAVAAEGLQTGIRPLGVKGICRARDGRLLMARRSQATLHSAGMWEFSPAGTVEPGVAPAQMLLRELREETGWGASTPPVARALLFDPDAGSWEIVYSLEVTPPAVPVESWECDELRLVAPGQWPAPLSPVSQQMMPVVQAVIDAA